MTGHLAQIARHPIKSHGREDMTSVLLTAGEGVPFDRHWAVAHDAAKLVAGWNECVNFARGAKAPDLMAISARLDEQTTQLDATQLVIEKAAVLALWLCVFGGGQQAQTTQQIL